MELSIRLEQSVHRLEAIDAERPCSLKTLLHVSLIASTIAALLAHTPPCAHPAAAGWSAPHGGSPAPPALGLAAGRLLSVHCPGF